MRVIMVMTEEKLDEVARRIPSTSFSRERRALQVKYGHFPIINVCLVQKSKMEILQEVLFQFHPSFIDGTMSIMSDWVNTNLGRVVVYYEMDSTVNWGAPVMLGDTSLRQHIPLSPNVWFPLVRRRAIEHQAREHLALQVLTEENQLLRNLVWSLMYLGTRTRHT